MLCSCKKESSGFEGATSCLAQEATVCIWNVVLDLRNTLSTMVWNSGYNSPQPLPHYKNTPRYHNKFGTVKLTFKKCNTVLKEMEKPHTE